MYGRHNKSKATNAHGFTLIELLVVVAIIALLISILLPALGKAKEQANRLYCATNLRSMATAMHLYAEGNNSSFPVTRPPPTAGAYFNGFSGSVLQAQDGEAIAAMLTSQQGVVLSSLWILVLRNDMQPKMLFCKSDRFVVDPAARFSNGYYANFQNAQQISYSIAYPWIGGGQAGYWRATLEASIPLAADMAPLKEAVMSKDPTLMRDQTGKGFNSGNHQDIGQNVMFGDTHVEFARHPYQGAQNDNIYTTGVTNSQSTQVAPGLNNIGPQASAQDIVLVPVRQNSDGQMGN